MFNVEGAKSAIPEGMLNLIEDLVDPSVASLFKSRNGDEIKALFENCVYKESAQMPQDCAEILQRMRQFYLNQGKERFDVDAKILELFQTNLKNRVAFQIQLKTANENRIEEEVQRRVAIALAKASAKPSPLPVPVAVIAPPEKVSPPNLDLDLFTACKEVTPAMIYALACAKNIFGKMDDGLVNLINSLKDEEVCNLLRTIPDFAGRQITSPPKPLFLDFFQAYHDHQIDNIASAINQFPRIATKFYSYFQTFLAKPVPDIALDQLPKYSIGYHAESNYISASFSSLSDEEIIQFVNELKATSAVTDILIFQWTHKRGNFFETLVWYIQPSDILKSMVKFSKLHNVVKLLGRP